MTTEFIVTMPHKPGQLAELGSVLGQAHVNVEALQAVALGDRGIIHFVTSQTDAAQAALTRGGYDFRTREVLVVHVLNEPGTLGDVAHVMADAGINIDAAYVTVGGNVVLGVDDLDGARQVASGMAVSL
jgi:hypothetical protein